MSEITGNTAFTLDGVSDFSIGGDVYSWDGGFVGYIDVWSGNPSLTATVTVTLASSGWDIGTLRFSGDANLLTVINDTTNNTDFQSIEYLLLRGAGGSTVTLTNTEVHLIQTGNASVSITTGNAWLGSLLAQNGNDLVRIGVGGADSLRLGSGNNAVVTNGFVETISAFGGNDTVTVGSAGAGAIILGHGNNRVFANGWVASVTAYSGNDTVSTGIDGAGTIDLGNGNNTVTTSTGHVSAIVAGNGADTVNLGAGGAGAIQLYGGNDTVNVARQIDLAYNPIAAEGGVDTFNFAAFSVGLNVSLLSPAAVVSSSQGSFILSGFENLSGGSGNDVLTGNNGANVLRGGAGSDVLIGGNGNDTFALDNGTDTVNDASGIDTITSTISRSLGGYATIENLSLVNVATALNAAGNGLNNVLVGNSFNNVLSGGAGNDLLRGLGGNDTLIGGAGNDVFQFDLAPNATTNRDTITDFNVANDTLRLENAAFTAVGAPGVLAAAAFRVGAAAADANDRVIYNSATGALIYDSNGSAAGGAVQFATVSAGLALTNADFQII